MILCHHLNPVNLHCLISVFEKPLGLNSHNCLWSDNYNTFFLFCFLIPNGTWRWQPWLKQVTEMTDPPTLAPWAECWWILGTPLLKPRDIRTWGIGNKDGLMWDFELYTKKRFPLDSLSSAPTLGLAPLSAASQGGSLFPQVDLGFGLVWRLHSLFFFLH